MSTQTKTVERAEVSQNHVSWEVWMSCLSQARIDKIALKTGFKTTDGNFNPDKSSQFNDAVNRARARKLNFV